MVAKAAAAIAIVAVALTSSLDAAEAHGSSAKRSGSYFATSTMLLYKYSLTDSLRVAPALSFASHNIDDVPGIEDRNQFEFQGIGAEVRYRLRDRAQVPFGFTLS